MRIIYKLTAPNGKIYIGQTNNLVIRFNSYKSLRCKHQSKLYNSLKKYGWKNFNKEILEYTTDELVNDLEIYYIKKYNSSTAGLNFMSGGNWQPKSKGQIPWNKGLKRVQKGYWIGKKRSAETISAIVKAHKGKPLTDEHKKKISEVMKGHKKPPRSKQHCINLSKSCKGRIPWNKGLKGCQIPWNKGLKIKT